MARRPGPFGPQARGAIFAGKVAWMAAQSAHQARSSAGTSSGLGGTNDSPSESAGSIVTSMVRRVPTSALGSLESLITNRCSHSRSGVSSRAVTSPADVNTSAGTPGDSAEERSERRSKTSDVVLDRISPVFASRRWSIRS